MGQVNATLNPENHPQVWVMEPKPCDIIGCNVQQFPLNEKPAEMVNVDHALWTQFGDAINDLLPGMNQCIKPLWTIGLLVIIACAVLVPVLRAAVLDEKSESGGFLILIPIAIWLVVFATFSGCQFRIATMNEAVDDEIRKTIGEFAPRFMAKGFSPQYRTKWIAFCKPRYAQPQRLIVFVPTESKV